MGQRCRRLGPGDYPPDATCKQLTKDPYADKKEGYPHWDEGLNYGNAVYYWRMTGSPGRMDPDGNGKPCERVYPKPEVSRYFHSTLQP